MLQLSCRDGRGFRPLCTVLVRTVSAEISTVLVRTVSAEIGTVLVRTVSTEKVPC